MDTRADRFSTGGVSRAGRPVVGPRRFGEQRFMRLLGLTTTSVDPVTIITAAQVTLRRWRRLVEDQAGTPCLASDRIRQITEARDILLRQALPRTGESASRTRS